MRQSLIPSHRSGKPEQGGVVGANPSPFFELSSSYAACRRGASHGTGLVGRAVQKGVIFGIRHALSFAPAQLVIQQVIPLYFFMKALMEQLPLRLLCRLDAPSVVPPKTIAQCKTYREAVRLCWDLRRVTTMTQQRLAEEAGLYAPHVTCYLRDGKRQRDLPGWAVRGFEWVCGNTAISQWHAQQAKLTCLEEMQAMREVA
jgi:hypothetical protein